MLGGSEFRLRRGFACGKTLVRRKSAADQKGRWPAPPWPFRAQGGVLQVCIREWRHGKGPPDFRGALGCDVYMSSRTIYLSDQEFVRVTVTDSMSSEIVPPISN